MAAVVMLAKPWTPSASALSLVKQFEKFAPLYYRDENHLWTIGWGHKIGPYLGDDPPYGVGITPAQADVLLTGDMALATGVVNRLVYVKLSGPMADALISLVYNIGGGNFASSTLRKLLNLSDYHAAADQFLVWDHVNHVVSHGLMERRQSEQNLFLSGAP